MTTIVIHYYYIIAKISVKVFIVVLDFYFISRSYVLFWSISYSESLETLVYFCINFRVFVITYITLECMFLIWIHISKQHCYILFFCTQIAYTI